MKRIVTEKRCSKCKEIKLTARFYGDKSRADGLSSRCKPCAIEYAKARRLSNPQRHNELTRKWYYAHHEQAKASARANAPKHKEKKLEGQRRRRKEHPEKDREWNANHKESISASRRRWRLSNPDRVRVIKENRRMREASAGPRVTYAEWKTILDKYEHACLYPGCGNTDVEIDHIVPISRGGTHSIDNLQPLCKSHNSSKGAKTIDYRPKE